MTENGNLGKGAIKEWLELIKEKDKEIARLKRSLPQMVHDDIKEAGIANYKEQIAALKAENEKEDKIYQKLVAEYDNPTNSITTISRAYLKKLEEDANRIAEKDKEFDKLLEQKFTDTNFVECVVKPLMNDFYRKQGKNTKGELLVINANNELKLNIANKKIAELKAENEKLIKTIGIIGFDLLINQTKEWIELCDDAEVSHKGWDERIGLFLKLRTTAKKDTRCANCESTNPGLPTCLEMKAKKEVEHG